MVTHSSKYSLHAKRELLNWI